jgi:hypothetical protein
MNLFRLPLNIFVVVVLSKERHPSLVLMICAAALAVASGLQVSQYLLLLFSPLTPPSLTPLPPLQHVFSSMRAPPALPLAEVDDDQIVDDNQSL